MFYVLPTALAVWTTDTYTFIVFFFLSNSFFGAFMVHALGVSGFLSYHFASAGCCWLVVSFFLIRFFHTSFFFFFFW
jgi:hypothetical protein